MVALELLSLLFVPLLMLLLLAMERVEMPLREAAVTDKLTDFFDEARPEEIEAFVSEGLDSALTRYWRRRRRSR